MHLAVVVDDLCDWDSLCFFIHFGSRASDYGLMKINNKGQVLYFNEKPKGDDLTSMVIILYLTSISASFPKGSNQHMMTCGSF